MTKIKEMTDEELAIAYIEGNENAFELLLQRTKSNVFSYIIYTVHNEELANDLFQETYAKAIGHLQSGRFSATGKIQSWLICIAHNVIMDNYRRSKVHNIIDNGDDNDLSNISTDHIMDISRESQFVNEQTAIDIRNMIEYLPNVQKDVIIMRYYQNLSFKEIAETMGVSINTALGRMRYAIHNLRKIARNNNIELRIEE